MIPKCTHIVAVCLYNFQLCIYWYDTSTFTQTDGNRQIHTQTYHMHIRRHLYVNATCIELLVLFHLMPAVARYFNTDSTRTDGSGVVFELDTFRAILCVFGQGLRCRGRRSRGSGWVGAPKSTWLVVTQRLFGFFFIPKIWGNDPMWLAHGFSDGLVQPPTRIKLGTFLNNTP